MQQFVEQLGVRRNASEIAVPDGNDKPRKVRAQQDKITRLAVATAKLSLGSATRSRHHDACLMHTIIVPSQHSVVVAMESGREYNAACLRSKGTKMSASPHLFAWSSAVMAAIALPGITPTDKSVLEQHAASMSSSEQLAEHVFVARCSPAYLQGTHKLSFSVSEPLKPVLESMFRLLSLDGGCVKHGTPPCSSHERTVARLLQELGEW
eukprot:CAMPEP_0115076190 /NCGR_PEP_ID=MMETSP0227-20121206/16291_1 /TAXON_ID=89957 /ORGANISM="Polarella glacialis, Strain CCMP 1383" /LENGTH=208 /DNA_ID=CAMNT_0002463307 /DNA_START=37 /DNA_END=660 /DNA_ORIENTATION=-